MQKNHGFIFNVLKIHFCLLLQTITSSLTVSSSDKQFSCDNDLNSTDACFVLNPLARFNLFI